MWQKYKSNTKTQLYHNDITMFFTNDFIITIFVTFSKITYNGNKTQ